MVSCPRPSDDGIRWHDVSQTVNRTLSETAGQRPFGAGNEESPQQDSNLRSRLRRVCRFKSLTFTDEPDPEILERRGSAGLRSGRISGCVVSRARSAHAFVGEGAQTSEVAVLSGRVVLARGGLLPQTTGCEEPVCAVAPEALIEVQQSADGRG